MTTREEIEHLLTTQGVVAVKEATPAQQRMLSRLCRDSKVARILPGIYCHAGQADDWRVRCAAVNKWDPDAVITGRSAAKLTFWPDLTVRQIEISSRRKRTGPDWLVIRRRTIDSDDIAEREGLRVTRAARTAMDLAASDEGETIDVALRERVVTLKHLAAALQRALHRAGNKARRRVLRLSRNNPWSQAERLLHRVLFEAGISGWVGNHWVTAGECKFAIDVAFPHLRLAIEVDGRQAHGPEAFESDRKRQNLLYSEEGWVTLRFTWQMLQDPETVVAMVRNAIRQCSRRGRRRRPQLSAV